MRLLLDTHIWLWSQVEPRRLAARVRKALTAEDAEPWLSPISVWEFLLLVERERLDLGSLKPTEWLELADARAPCREAPLTREVALRSRALGLSHEDPADRFLAATAAVYDLTLVTADERLLRGKGYRTLANR